MSTTFDSIVIGTGQAVAELLPTLLGSLKPLD